LADGQPVLIDFENSIFDRALYERGPGSVMRRDVTGKSFRSRLHLFINGRNQVAPEQCDRFLQHVKRQAARPTVLVIGGGKIGQGAGGLYDDPDVEIVGTDVYASPYTCLLADAHGLPFPTASFDGVWLQAVLEHALEPATVVAEVHRVLKPGGIVYAETPFMQEVHEGAYDFTRFTLSGHRWLFKNFEQINAGVVSGPGVALVWSIRYLSRALGSSEAMSRLVSLPFFWLRYLDRLTRGRRAAADGASGVFFLGRRSEARLSPKAMPNYYEQQQSDAWRPRVRESLMRRALSLGSQREPASKTRSRRLPQA
jgi:SAM-dependent methyltransferase